MLPKQKYTFLSALNTGGIENGCTCDNCGRVITNVVTIEDGQKNRYNVGEDCAVTLQGIGEDFDFRFSTLPIFTALKGFNAKVRKAVKEGCFLKEWHEYQPNKGFFKQGGFSVTFGNYPTQKGSFWVNEPIEYLPIYRATLEKLAGKQQ